MYLLILSFIAGILTVLAPCVLPILPVIIVGSLNEENKKGPLIITLSLAASLIIFTLILKASTLFISIDPLFWNAMSGGIIITIGVITLFPQIWDKFSLALSFSAKSDQLLQKSSEKQGVWRNILTGMALGPVFSSCSPTYAVVLATVLPQNFITGLTYLLAYAIGLSLVLFLISIYGQRLIKRLKWATNPYGLFKKILGIIFILVGLGIVTGLDKKFQTLILDAGFFDITKIEFKFLERLDNNSNISTTLNGPILNVKVPQKAPEIQDIAHWFNSNGETLENLKGKVVLVDFWTYSCINCIRTLPFLKSWDEKYRDKGLVILGIHSPEFAFEKEVENVEKSIKDFEIKYPVAMDNNFSTWRAYNNRYWPAKYFIDKNGYIRHFHFGEGAYTDSEEVIRFLLEETNADVSNTELGIHEPPENFGQRITPETYLGYARMESFANLSDLKKDTSFTYNAKINLESDQWTLGGDWEIKSMDTTSKSDNATLTIKFSAKEVYLVMGSDAEAQVLANDEQITVKDAKLYTVYKSDQYNKDQILKLTFPREVTINAFTFGN